MRYKVGMIGGSFNPLHNGHVDCILRAAGLCEELYVVISVGTNREEIPVRVRYRWLYQLTKHLPNVTLMVLEDTCKTKGEYTLDIAQRDSDEICRRIGKNIDVVFCGGDYDETSFWNVCYPQSELVIFDRTPQNSTAIRENLYAHWEWLPSFVRPYFVKKVLLIGGESTGKSTLTVNLAHRFCTNYVEEAGREISLRSGADTLMLPEDYTDILLTHKQNEIEAIQHSNKLLFVDTDALVTLFYMGFLDDDATAPQKCLADGVDSVNNYDLILFLEPDVQFVQDGSRNVQIEREREKYSEKIKEVLRAHHRPFVCLSGDYDERFCRAVELSEKLLMP